MANNAMIERATTQQHDARAPALTPVGSGILQRICACGGVPGPTGECAECRKKRLGLQRKVAIRAAVPSVPPVVHDVLRSSGQPLDVQTRAFMEPQLGYDFGHVRVHTDARAAESARAVDAHAYTVGQHIVFGVGQYAPRTTAGKTLLAHELAHVVQQRAGAASSPVEIGRADDRYEREAERVAGNVVSEAPVGTLAQAPRLVVSRIGGLGYAPDPRDELIRKQYREFIENAERYGMPTRFLRAVARDYPLLRGGGDFVKPVLNYMVLTEETMKSVAKMSPSLPSGESRGIQTIYHESTHAYLDLASDEEKTAEAIKAGVAHYKDAPLRGGGRADDPERLFQEAAASYVGHRVATWWMTFEKLSLAAAGEIPPDKIAEWVADARQEYDAEMARREFGYQETGGFLGIGASQIETTRGISPQLRGFLDASVLEGKVPDKFDDVAGFQELVARAMSRQSSQGEAAPPAQSQPGGPAIQRWSTSPHGRLEVSAANGPLEREADAVAAYALGEQTSAPVPSFGLSTRRQPAIQRVALHTGNILDEGTCEHLACNSKYSCEDNKNGITCPQGTRNASETKKYRPLFTCDAKCENNKTCSDADNWMALPGERWARSKCNQDLVICANGKFTHGYVRDKSETAKAWEVSHGIQDGLGVSPYATFTGAIYPDESDAQFKKDVRCQGRPAAPSGETPPQSETPPQNEPLPTPPVIRDNPSDVIDE